MAGPEAPRRPKLSLQTKSIPSSQVRTRKSMLANADPKSPTTFNTLSNVYVTAIERSTPTQSTPLTAIKMQPLKLRTDAATLNQQHRTLQPTFANTLPDTPLSANPLSPGQPMDMVFPSQQMTATPPLSAGASDNSGQLSFSFADSEAAKSVGSPRAPASPVQSRRRAIYSAFGTAAAAANRAPYSRNRALHSILRNSPLPPSSAVPGAEARSPVSPRRQSRRLQERAARRVGYESPLTQTITTEKYTQSHIDLLLAEMSPHTASPVAGTADSDTMLDFVAPTSTAETRDGGQTPGPFEEMRRRMTGLGTGGPATAAAESPVLSPRTEGGIRKRSNSGGSWRRRKEKRRKWVWTIGNQEDDEEDGGVGQGRRRSSGTANGPAMRAVKEAVAASLSSEADASTPRASSQSTVSAQPPPLPPRLIIDSGPRDERTPEPITAVKISVEATGTESEPQATDSDCMDVDMSEGDDGASVSADDSNDSGSDSSRATTPYSMEIDLVTPTVAGSQAKASGRETERPGSLDPGAAEMDTSGSTRRDTPIPPDLVASAC